jgi:hypothetical protein
LICKKREKTTLVKKTSSHIFLDPRKTCTNHPQFFKKDHYFSTKTNRAQTHGLVQEREVLQFLMRSSGFSQNMKRETLNMGLSD